MENKLRKSNVDLLAREIMKGLKPKWYAVLHLNDGINSLKEQRRRQDEIEINKDTWIIKNALYTQLYGKKWKKNKRRAKSIWSIEYGKTKLTPHINLIIEQLPFPYDDFRSLFVLLDRLLPYECKCLNRRNKTVDLQPVFLENGINQYITKEIKSDNKTTTILKSDFCKSDLLHHINDYFLTTNPL